jgi:hypothetical protein
MGLIQLRTSAHIVMKTVQFEVAKPKEAVCEEINWETTSFAFGTQVAEDGNLCHCAIVPHRRERSSFRRSLRHRPQKMCHCLACFGDKQCRSQWKPDCFPLPTTPNNTPATSSAIKKAKAFAHAGIAIALRAEAAHSGTAHGLRWSKQCHTRPCAKQRGASSLSFRESTIPVPRSMCLQSRSRPHPGGLYALGHASSSLR